MHIRNRCISESIYRFSRTRASKKRDFPQLCRQWSRRKRASTMNAFNYLTMRKIHFVKYKDEVKTEQGIRRPNWGKSNDCC